VLAVIAVGDDDLAVLLPASALAIQTVSEGAIVERL
jgi:hypothetical protein